MTALWIARQPPPAFEFVQILEATGLPRELAHLLAQRGVTSAAEAAAFLAPGLDSLHDPLLLKGMNEALDLLVAVHGRGEPVAVIGDYDVDGLTATALLLGVFQAVGLTAHGILPNRHAGGYGPQLEHVQQADALGCRLLVTADCGIQAQAAITAARQRGMQVIVTDHHLPGELPLEGAVVINPRQDGCSYPFRDLAGVGLALKLGAALLQRFGREVPWPALCRISCLGTIADAAPLVGENRVLASRGLAALADTPSVGLRALFAEAEVTAPISAHDVGFRLGPRLNAAGRLGAADPALELLLTRDPARAKALAAELGRCNTERRVLEKQVVDDCAARYAGNHLPAVLVGWSADWNRGVVGIAAGRLARLFHRPALLFAVKDGVAVGSGRSVPGIDLHEFLRAWADRLERFGGHAQAVGLTTSVATLEVLAAEWEKAAKTWPPESLTPAFEYDLHLTMAEVTSGLLERLARLEPFGVGNPEPVFAFGPCRRAGVARTFGGGHIGFMARDGAEPSGDAAGQGESADGAAGLGNGGYRGSRGGGAIGAGGASGAGASVEVVAWHWAERAAASGLFDGEFEMLAVVELDRYRNRPRLRLVDGRPAAPRTK